MSVTRFFGGPSLLILAHSTYFNTGAAAGFGTLVLTLDGTNVPPQGRTGVMLAGEQEESNLLALLPITEGLHTIALNAQRTNDALQIPNHSAILTAIELPDWDDEANLITL